MNNLFVPFFGFFEFLSEFLGRKVFYSVILGVLMILWHFLHSYWEKRKLRKLEADSAEPERVRRSSHYHEQNVERAMEEKTRQILSRLEPEVGLSKTAEAHEKIVISQVGIDKVRDTILRTKQAMNPANIPLPLRPRTSTAPLRPPATVATNLRITLRKQNTIRTAFLAHEIFSLPLSLRGSGRCHEHNAE